MTRASGTLRWPLPCPQPSSCSESRAEPLKAPGLSRADTVICAGSQEGVEASAQPTAPLCQSLAAEPGDTAPFLLQFAASQWSWTKAGCRAAPKICA
jgi:hypothetical protein